MWLSHIQFRITLFPTTFRFVLYYLQQLIWCMNHIMKYKDQMWSICLNAQIRNVVVYIIMLSAGFFFLVLHNTIHISWILQNHSCFHILYNRKLLSSNDRQHSCKWHVEMHFLSWFQKKKSKFLWSQKKLTYFNQNPLKKFNLKKF